MENRTYLCIDLKSFYASVECVERGLDPLKTNLLVADAAREDGARALTLTFYAPEALADTTLTQDADGTLHLQTGSLVLEGAAAQRMAPLLTLLPSSGEVQGVSLTDQGHTRVQGKDFVLDFLPDGTPYRVQTATAEITVVSFGAP